MHADGSEEITARVASENHRAAAITNGEVRFLMGTWREREGERRQFNRGCNLIGVDRRKGERRS
jgi:hypothetical protein